MQTRSQDIESLLTDGVFDVPDYQRNYSWEDRQLDDLLDDIRYLPDDQSHFFGNVILEKQEDSYDTASGRRLNAYHIVDGQQRLTTTLMFLSVARQLSDRVATLVDESNALHVPKDRPRLLPQSDDREYFRDAVLGDTDLTADTPSQHRLQNACSYFQSKLKELAEEDAVAELAQTLLYQFQVNVVEVDNDSEAASIFESINDRGKPLSSLEKTKSFLMYMDDRAAVDRSLRTKIHDRFGGIYRQLFVLEAGHKQVDNFDEDTFQQLHWGFYDGYDSDEYFNPLQTLKSRLYEAYRRGDHEEVSTTIDAYTKSLREASTTFDQFFRPADRESDDVSAALSRLLSLGRVANILPVVMVAFLEYDDPDQLTTILQKCETLVFRVYAIDNRRSNTGRSKLVNLAHEMYTEPSHGFEDTLRRLEEITRDYADDDRFERKLRDPEFYNSVSSTDIRYLLFHYGQQLEADVDEEVSKDLDQILSTEFSVEHVLAQSLDDEHIPSSITDDYDDHVHRLGNLTVAKKEWNSKYGDLPFEDKKHVPEDGQRDEAYENSTLKVQRVLKDIDEFDRDTIEEREEELVQFALNEWSVQSHTLDTSDLETVASIIQKIRESRSVDSDHIPVTELELYTLAAVFEEPGRALRSVHETVAHFEEAPVSWTESWGAERKAVQRALWSLRRMNLVSLDHRSWYPSEKID